MNDDLQQLEEQLNAAKHDAETLVNGLSEKFGTWHANAASWSVAECLDHLATTNCVYLDAMRVPAANALKAGRRGSSKASPGIIGRFFVHALEPPVNPRLKGKAAQIILPRLAIPLADASSNFEKSQAKVHAFVREYADIDLSGVLFLNPFVNAS